MSGKIKFAVATVIAGLLGTAASTQAATVLKSGDKVSGWKLTFPVGISLVIDSPSSLSSHVPVIKVEKAAAFTNEEGLVINFTQVDYQASSQITFVNESLTNVAANTWGGFQFLLMNQLTGNGADAAFHSAAATFAPGVDNNFTSVAYSPDTITYGGGNVGQYDTAQFGFGATGGDLTIDTHPSATGLKKVFGFKEQPVLVPLPAAAWSGLSGLVGLGLVAYGKNLKKILA